MNYFRCWAYAIFWLNYVENICTPYIMKIVRGPCRSLQMPYWATQDSLVFHLVSTFESIENHRPKIDLWTSRRKMWRKSLKIEGNNCFFFGNDFSLSPLNPKRKMRIYSIMAFVLKFFVSFRFALMWLLNNENDVSIFINYRFICICCY